MKRILTVQDISCVGKCSLTVALPIISAFGVETAVLPTAVLSNHTAFKGWTFRDLTDDITPIKERWIKENINFDAIYTGYLGSQKQIDLVLDLFKTFSGDKRFSDNNTYSENNTFSGNNTFTLVDPAMADNGKLYSGFDLEFANKMKDLCSYADYIVPNLTEASLLLGEEYVSEGYTEEYVQSTLKKLVALGCKRAILTGISLEKGKLGAYAYDGELDKFYQYYSEKIPVNFHGTGDVFASAICGSLSIGKSLEHSIKIAVDFTVESIKKTIEDENGRWYGVNFESAFPLLLEIIK